MKIIIVNLEKITINSAAEVYIKSETWADNYPHIIFSFFFFLSSPGCLSSCHCCLAVDFFFLSFFLFFSRSSMAPLHGKNRLGCCTFPFYLCRSVAVQGAVAYLVSASDSSDTHSPFPVSGCHVSLLVKSPQRERRKPQRQPRERWSKTSRFYSEPSVYNPVFISLWSGETGTRK